MAAQTDYSTTMTPGFAGQLYATELHMSEAMRNDEATAEIPFGAAVQFASLSDPTSAKLPAANTNKIAGIVVHSHRYSSIDLGTVGIKPTVVTNVLRKGKIVVKVETAVNVGDRLYVRAVVNGNTVVGAILNAADGGNTIDCTNQGVFITAASANGLAVLDVDFINKPGI